MKRPSAPATAGSRARASVGVPVDETRAQVVAALGERLGRRHSARVVLFHQAVADRLGLGGTDLKCLDLASDFGARGEPLTAGDLAALTGLTTGAITGVVDRLEAAGFLRRTRDETDRRRVLLSPVPGREEEIAEVFRPVAESMARLCAGYDDEELVVVARFITEADDLLERETAALRSGRGSQGGSGRERS